LKGKNPQKFFHFRNKAKLFSLFRHEGKYLNNKSGELRQVRRLEAQQWRFFLAIEPIHSVDQQKYYYHKNIK